MAAAMSSTKDPADLRFERFGKNELLLGAPAVQQFANASVCVVGCGGVGSWTVESLARAGIGRLVLIDPGIIKISNCSQQIQALDSTIGLNKVDVLARRVADINPACQIIKKIAASNQDTASDLIRSLGPFDALLDAADSLTDKAATIAAAVQAGIPCIATTCGAATRMDPTLIRCDDMSRSSRCPVARILRRNLSRYDIKTGVVFIYSLEEPRNVNMTSKDKMVDDARRAGFLQSVSERKQQRSKHGPAQQETAPQQQQQLSEQAVDTQPAMAQHQPEQTSSGRQGAGAVQATATEHSEPHTSSHSAATVSTTCSSSQIGSQLRTDINASSGSGSGSYIGSKESEGSRSGLIANAGTVSDADISTSTLATAGSSTVSASTPSEQHTTVPAAAAPTAADGDDGAAINSPVNSPPVHTWMPSPMGSWVFCPAMFGLRLGHVACMHLIAQAAAQSSLTLSTASGQLQAPTASLSVPASCVADSVSVVPDASASQS